VRTIVPFSIRSQIQHIATISTPAAFEDRQGLDMLTGANGAEITPRLLG
jgi:hypothetical protein